MAAYVLLGQERLFHGKKAPSHGWFKKHSVLANPSQGGPRVKDVPLGGKVLSGWGSEAQPGAVYCWAWEAGWNGLEEELKPGEVREGEQEMAGRVREEEQGLGTVPQEMAAATSDT